MALQFRHNFLLTLISSAMILCACQAESPTPKTSSTQDLFAQVEAMEADEASSLFQQAKVSLPLKTEPSFS